MNNDSLVIFLYLLMRDHLPPGEVEKLMDQSLIKDNAVFSNEGTMEEG